MWERRRKPEGTEGCGLIMSLQFRPGRASGGWPRPAHRSPPRGAGWKLLERLLPVAACPCQWTQVPAKGQVREFLKFIYRQCLFFILLHHEVLFGAFG